MLCRGVLNIKKLPVRLGTISSHFLNSRACRPRLYSSSRPVLLWKKVEKLLGNCSSVEDVNDVLLGFADNGVSENVVFANVGQTICDRIEYLVSDCATAAELIGFAQKVPVGTLDTLASSVLLKVHPSPEEFVRFCEVLSSRSSGDFRYKFQCVGSYLERHVGEHASISVDEYTLLLKSVLRLRAICKDVNTSSLVALGVKLYSCKSASPFHQVHLLQLLRSCSSHSADKSAAWLKLWNSVCSDLLKSAWQLKPSDWLLILQCLNERSLAKGHPSLVSLCLNLLLHSLGELSLPQVFSMTDLHHVPLRLLHGGLVDDLTRRLSFADGTSIVKILSVIIGIKALTPEIVEIVCTRVVTSGLSKKDVVNLLNAVLAGAELQGSEKLAKLVPIACNYLWKQGVSVVEYRSDAVSVIDFAHATKSPIPSDVVCSAMRILLDCKQPGTYMQQLLAGLLVLKRTDSLALFRFSRDIHERFYVDSLHLPWEPLITLELVTLVVNTFTVLQYTVGNWLHQCSTYASQSMPELLAKRSRVVADLAVLLVQHNSQEHAGFFEALVYHLTAWMPVNETVYNRELGMDYDEFHLSFAFLVTITWSCIGTVNQPLVDLLRAVNKSANVGAVLSTTMPIVERLVEINALAWHARHTSVLELNAEDACIKRLRAESGPPSVRQHTCLASLQQAVSNKAQLSLSAVTCFGIHVDALLFPCGVTASDYGGVECVRPNSVGVVVCFVDDGLLPQNTWAGTCFRERALAAAGFTVLRVDWQRWNAAANPYFFWQLMLKSVGIKL